MNETLDHVAREVGSRSIDGCGHAAVYAQGGAAAVADRESFAPEFQWQARRLAQLAAMETA